MTQHDVAGAVGMPQPSIARIEAGAVLPRTATLLTILTAIGHELIIEPRSAVRHEVRRAARERLSRSIPRRTWDALGRRGTTALLRTLRAGTVPFVLVGDVAEVVHGAPRTVGPAFEICHPTSALAAGRLADALRKMGAIPTLDPSDLRSDHDMRVTTDAGDLRLLSRTAAGDDYEVLARNASRRIIDTSLLVLVAALEDLMRIRRARGEDADLEILAAVDLERAPTLPGAGSTRRAAEG
jgi:hypothetical protein